MACRFLDNTIRLSNYASGLAPNCRVRYLQKLKTLGNIDPLNEEILSEFVTLDPKKVTDLPDLQYPDIYNYLINTNSAYTSEKLKAYKSLESYKYFVAGWVRSVAVMKTNAVYVLLAKVGFCFYIFRTAVFVV